MSAKKLNLKNTIFGGLGTILLASLFAAFLIKERSELSTMRQIVTHADWLFVGLGIIFTIIYVYGQALFYQTCLKAVGADLPFGTAVKVYLKRFFLSSFIPAGFTVSQYTLTHELKPHKINDTQSHLASTLYLLTGAVAYLAFLIPTMAYLMLTHQLTRVEVYLSIAILVITLLIVGEFVAIFRQHGVVYNLTKRFLPSVAGLFNEWKTTTINRSIMIEAFFSAIFVDCVSIVMLFATFAALHIPASFVLSLIGYVITVLVLTISPIFQGVGLVEISLVYVLIQFGISNEKALAVTLLYRFFQLWLPLLAGLILVIQKRLAKALHNLPPILTFLFGVSSIVSAVNPRLSPRLLYVRELVPMHFFLYSRGFVLVLGFLFLLLTYNLTRRLRRAWVIAMILTVVSIVANVLKGLDVDQVLFGLVVLGSLMLAEHEYRVKSDPPSGRRSLLIVVLTFLSSLLYGVLGFYFLDKRAFATDFNLKDSFIHVFRLYFELGDRTLVPHTLFAVLFIVSIYLVAIISIIYAAVVLFEPALVVFGALPYERALAESLVRKYGHNSLDHFKVYWDKHFFFNEEKTAFVAYKPVNGVALVLGDPVGEDKTAVKAVLKEFFAFVQHHHWRLAFQQVSEEYLLLYESLGFKALKLGEEAEVSLTTFSLDGRAGKDFRYILRRYEREGYTYKFYEPPLTPQLLRRLHAVSDDWLKLPFRTERIFAQGMYQTDEVRQTAVATVEDKDGRLVAFINILPDYAPKKAVLDLLRRRQTIPNGAMEFLLIQTFLTYKEKGYESFSLGLAPLSGVGEAHDAEVPEKTLKLLYDTMNSLFSYKGLREFKAKFNPEWRPRYMIYRTTAQLPSVAVASLRASHVGGLKAFFSWLKK